MFCFVWEQINFDLHVCLENPDGKDIDGSEKEAVVEVSLEYEWASQDDSKEVNLRLLRIIFLAFYQNITNYCD